MYDEVGMDLAFEQITEELEQLILNIVLSSLKNINEYRFSQDLLQQSAENGNPLKKAPLSF